MILATLKMALATFSSRILGLVREQVIAATFGASGVTDAFTVAYRIPNMLRDLFAEGVFSSSFVPIFSAAHLESEEKAKKLFWSALISLGAITTVLSLMIIFFSEEVVRLVTNDQFIADQERFILTIELVKILAPFLVLISLAALFMGVLNTLKVFFIPSFAPAFFNVVMILSVYFLPEYLETQGIHSIFALAIGVIGGGVAQMLIQIPLLIKRKFFQRVERPFFDRKGMNKIISRLGVGTIGVAATQINVLVTTILATGTVLGAVSWMNYAFRLFQFPVGILSVSIAGSNLVHFSEAWKKGDLEEAKGLIKGSYLFSFFTVIPVFVILYVLAYDISKMIFERGNFSFYDTLMVGTTLKAYLIGLPFYGLYKILSPVFFTLDRPDIPVKISVFTIALNIIFCLAMVDKFGFVILAVGTSLTMIVNCILQCYMLRKSLNLSLDFFLNLKLVKYVLAGAVCYFACKYFRGVFGVFDEGLLQLFLSLSFISILVLICYLSLLLIMGEGKTIKSLAKR